MSTSTSESTTANRICATYSSGHEDFSLVGAADQIVGLCAPALVSWKRGTEPPPFTVVNPAAVTLCLQIVFGAAVDLPEIFVSEAVAVQVYRLVHDQKAPAKLRASGANGVYRPGAGGTFRAGGLGCLGYSPRGQLRAVGPSARPLH